MNVNIKLQIFKMKEASGTSLAQRYRCAVVDLDRPEKYPSNFVCMLPAQIGSDKDSAFVKLFGDKSIELASQLLTDALETETDVETKAEIGRRLKIIKSPGVNQVECSVCGKLFKPTRRRGFRQKICPECRKRIYVDESAINRS
ncbi:MAG: hypothetical protein ABSB40_02600 [Nitrososphaeria archaeon]|jgi:hypothetical protein